MSSDTLKITGDEAEKLADQITEGSNQETPEKLEDKGVDVKTDTIKETQEEELTLNAITELLDKKIQEIKGTDNGTVNVFSADFKKQANNLNFLQCMNGTTKGYDLNNTNDMLDDECRDSIVNVVATKINNSIPLNNSNNLQLDQGVPSNFTAFPKKRGRDIVISEFFPTLEEVPFSELHDEILINGEDKLHMIAHQMQYTSLRTFEDIQKRSSDNDYESSESSIITFPKGVRLSLNQNISIAELSLAFFKSMVGNALEIILSKTQRSIGFNAGFDKDLIGTTNVPSNFYYNQLAEQDISKIDGGFLPMIGKNDKKYLKGEVTFKYDTDFDIDGMSFIPSTYKLNPSKVRPGIVPSTLLKNGNAFFNFDTITNSGNEDVLRLFLNGFIKWVKNVTKSDTRSFIGAMGKKAFLYINPDITRKLSYMREFSGDTNSLATQSLPFYLGQQFSRENIKNIEISDKEVLNTGNGIGDGGMMAFIGFEKSYITAKTSSSEMFDVVRNLDNVSTNLVPLENNGVAFYGDYNRKGGGDLGSYQISAIAQVAGMPKPFQQFALFNGTDIANEFQDN